MSEGIAQGPYLAAGEGFKPATFRMEGTELTAMPHKFLYISFLLHISPCIPLLISLPVYLLSTSYFLLRLSVLLSHLFHHFILNFKLTSSKLLSVCLTVSLSCSISVCLGYATFRSRRLGTGHLGPATSRSQYKMGKSCLDNVKRK